MLRGNWTWSILGLITLVIRYFAVQHPEKTEEIYSRSFFPGIRNLIDKTISQLPFATVYIFVVTVILVVVFFIYHFIQKEGWKQRLGFSIRSLFNGLGVLVFFFLVLWGFNYQRIPIFQQIGMKPVPLNQEQLLGEMELTRKYCQSASL
jgi:hypothetical protein